MKFIKEVVCEKNWITCLSVVVPGFIKVLHNLFL